MHNLHFVVTKADNAQEACDNVEGFVEGFGNENNYFSVCGSVSENNEVFSTEGGRYAPEKENNTIKKINKWLQKVVTDYKKEPIAVTKFKNNEPLEVFEWLQIKAYANSMYNTYDFKDDFNCLKDEVFAYEYNEVGVTHDTTNEGKNTYVVFVDMHD